MESRERHRVRRRRQARPSTAKQPHHRDQELDLRRLLTPGNALNFLDTDRTLSGVVPSRTKRAKHDMFGNPAQVTVPPPSPASPPADPRASRLRHEFEYTSSWGNRANFGLAGPPGRVGSLVADLWAQWWRPWALVGVLAVMLGLVLVISALT